MSDEFVYIPVPRERAEEVYAILARPKARNEQVTADLIQRVYREAPDWMREVLDFLADRPDKEVSLEALADGLGRKVDRMPGVMGSLGRQSKKHGVPSKHLIRKRFSPDAPVAYTMPEKVAEAIQQAR